MPHSFPTRRSSDRDNVAGPFAGLAVIMMSLAFWGFLQEVAYAFIFFGCYALYRAGVSKRNGHWDGLAPLIIMAAASTLALRSEEHTSELQSLMRISYAVFCCKNKTSPPTYK